MSKMMKCIAAREYLIGTRPPPAGGGGGWGAPSCRSGLGRGRGGGPVRRGVGAVGALRPAKQGGEARQRGEPEAEPQHEQDRDVGVHPRSRAFRSCLTCIAGAAGSQVRGAPILGARRSIVLGVTNAPEGGWLMRSAPVARGRR